MADLGAIGDAGKFVARSPSARVRIIIAWIDCPQCLPSHTEFLTRSLTVDVAGEAVFVLGAPPYLRVIRSHDTGEFVWLDLMTMIGE